MKKILIAEDDRSLRKVISEALVRQGYEIQSTGNTRTLWKWISSGEGDLVITDVVMPDENGIELIPKIQNLRPKMKVVVMSAHNTLLNAIKANQKGAFDYLPKPFDLDQLFEIVKRALSEKTVQLTEKTPVISDKIPLIGQSPAMQDVYRTLARLITTDFTVLIIGESGTGKELFARAIHHLGSRANSPFIAVNVAAIPKELIESELFGHERGAFTGAFTKNKGRFEQANGGTLFLDEIGDMPMSAQTRLLRVLQDGEFTTVGGSDVIKSNVRIVAATHQDLFDLVHKGKFREDLYYRLNVLPINLPPLRSRLSDISELVNHFFSIHCSRKNKQKSLDSEGFERLKKHSWPGNVRELENFIIRLETLYSESVIPVSIVEKELSNLPTLNKGKVKTTIYDDTLGDAAERHIKGFFSMHEGALPASGLYERIMREIEKPLITATLQATHGNQIKAAHLLGINRNTLRKKIRQLGITVVKNLK
ncbi:MAG: nitrogen regulation protein NR(I) [Rickettsiales bacterium]|nr:nitrogen regulation protein NR(I) [Rickettsiales bacterium]